MLPPHFRQANRRERKQLGAEKRAFKSFYKRVKSLDADQRQPMNQNPLLYQQPPNELSAIKDAYTETVLRVPHYEAVYDEPWSENMAQELGEAVTAAITGHSQFTPPLRHSILVMTRQAIESRSRVLDAIDAELEALSVYEADFQSISRELNALQAQPVGQLEFNALSLTRDRLGGLRAQCDKLAASRQTQVRNRPEFTFGDVCTFEQYLYGDCESLHPVLDAIAALGTRLEGTRYRVDQRLLTAT